MPGRPDTPLRDPVFRLRLISALILGPLAAALMFTGGLVFTAWVAAFAAAMAWEWTEMSDESAPTIAYAIACSTATGAVLLAGQSSTLEALAWAAAGTIAGAVERRRRGWSIDALGVLYVSLSAALLAAMRADPDDGLVKVIRLLAVVWSADSFAYLVGTWLRGPKLLPQASPNKTWTGLIAGLAAGSAAAAVVATLFEQDMLHALVFGFVVALASVGGDLSMSLFKRSFGVKDSGSLIPGHGGVLDRVDALMMAVICAVLMDRFFAALWPVS